MYLKSGASFRSTLLSLIWISSVYFTQLKEVYPNKPHCAVNSPSISNCEIKLFIASEIVKVGDNSLITFLLPG